MSGPPAREAQELHARIGARRWVDLGAERPRAAENLVVRLETLEHDRGCIGVETLVAAGGAGEIPGVDDEVGQAGDERHLDGHLARTAGHGPVEHPRLAQRRERGLPHTAPFLLRVGAVVDACAESFRDLPLDFDHVVDELAYVPIGARSGVRPLVVADVIEAAGEASGCLFVPIDEVHKPSSTPAPIIANLDPLVLWGL